MKFANPLHHPVAVLAGGIVLVAGVRFIGIPNAVILPASIAVTVIGASVLQSQAANPQRLANQQVRQELNQVRQSAWSLAEKAEMLRYEAESLLKSGSSVEVELLGIVQYGCDRAVELPEKVEHLALRLEESDDLLSVNQLRQRHAAVQTKLDASSGITRERLVQLATSLQRNIDLAQQGQDMRQAEIVSLSTAIQDAAGVLQQLQNKLRTANLADSAQLNELKSLSEELGSVQESVDILVSEVA